jgi:predicted ABC-type ATPase
VTGTIRAAARPRLWIVAGPNGSGKSSAYDQSDVGEFGGSVWIINPDLLTVRIRDVEGMTQTEANLAAVQRIEHWLDASIDTHQTIGVETVLSSPKYRRIVERAKHMSFEVWLIYVFLRSAELQLQRIAARVAKGGHAVAEDKVRARRERSFDQLPWFLNAADAAWIYDNSGDRPELVGKKDRGVLRLSEGMPGELLDRLPLTR